MAKNYPELGANLQRVLTICRLKKGELASLLGVAQSSISEWLNDVSDPSRAALEHICSRFGLRKDDLTHGTVERVVIDGKAYGFPEDTGTRGKISEEAPNDDWQVDNRLIARWLKETRERLGQGQREFYRNLGLAQQTGNNYENGKSPIPAWFIMRALRRHGNMDDLRAWMDFIQLSTGQRVTNIPVNSPARDALPGLAETRLLPAGSPSKVERRLHGLVERIVKLYALGRPDIEEHLEHQVKMIDELATAQKPNPAPNHEPGRAVPRRRKGR